MTGCPLCGDSRVEPFARDRRRLYLRCRRCALVSVPAEYHLDAAGEKTVYDLHRNSPDDAGYRRFLGRLCDPLAARLPPASEGLDFGCGPGPTLSVMLQALGYRVHLYDPFYAPVPGVFERRYDFITATEVVEHLARPGAVLEQLRASIRPGGWLGLMTKLVIDGDAFRRWHYKNDPTHIAFFSRQTFAWLGAQWGVEPVILGSDVILMQKPPG